MDTINSYLFAVARSLILSSDEKIHIDISISTLQKRLDSWFQKDVSKHFQFGSSVRETILPRIVDDESDIDYMVVFTNENKLKPASLLSKLRIFANYYYGKSEVYQDSPTMVLELNHIKFELVPAYQPFSWSDSFFIPAPSSGYEEWMTTEPYAIQKRVNDSNTLYNYQMKRLIRLLKYWNVNNSKVYSSYELEDHLSSRLFWDCTSLEDYFYEAVNGLPTYSLPQYKIEKVKRLQKKVAEIKKDYYINGFRNWALSDLGKLFPMP